MAFIPVPDGAEVVVHGKLFGQEIVNTLWFTETGAGAYTLEELNTLVGAVADAWRDELLPELSHDYTFVYATATDMQAPGGLQATYATASPQPGGRVGDSLPGNVAYVVSFRTGHTGRSYRGRNYVAGIDDTAVSGNALSSAYSTAILTAYQAILSAAEALGAVPVVVSKYADGAPRTTALTTPITTVMAVDLNLDSQRRRLTGRGS